MRKFLLLVGVLVAMVIPLGLSAPAAATNLPSPAAPDAFTVTNDPTSVSTVLGGRFTLRTMVTNTGSTASAPLLAHLNVASLTGSVYVDPEDWSANRSKYLAPLQPGESRALSWDLQAVNAGSFGVYIVALPSGDASVGKEPLAVSPMVKLDVATRSTLTAGGALPVTLVIPLLLGLAAAGARFRVRRRN